MAGFTKLFSEIVTSSIWGEDDKTRIVWVTMLALAGPDGIVKAALPGLANAARVSLADCERAIEKFEQPDKYSRSQGFEGRRVQRVEGGYLLLNYAKYRNELDTEKRKEYKAKKQAEYRERDKQKAKRKKTIPISGSAGERAYCKSIEDGEPPERQDEIVTEHLPEGLNPLQSCERRVNVP